MIEPLHSLGTLLNKGSPNLIKLDVIKESEECRVESISSLSASYVESEASAEDRNIPVPIQGLQNEATSVTQRFKT